MVNDAQGRVRSESTGPSAGFDGTPGVSDPADITAPTIGDAQSYDRTYSYDAAGRLSRSAIAPPTPTAPTWPPHRAQCARTVSTATATAPR